MKKYLYLNLSLIISLLFCSTQGTVPSGQSLVTPISKNSSYYYAAACAAMGGLTYYAYSNYMQPYETRWDWEKIAQETNDYAYISFPSKFGWGSSDSAHQVEGRYAGQRLVEGKWEPKLIENNWTEWEKETRIKNGKQVPGLPPECHVGNACERWTRYKEDIRLIKESNFDWHRYSISWEKVEPELNHFDKDVINHYIEFTQALIDSGIKPMPNFFHHTWPLWFEYVGKKDRKPAFEDAQNVQDFVNFAKKVIDCFKDANLLEHIDTWLTFNEPIGYAMAAYVDGSCPPGRKMDFGAAGRVSKNMLDAHIAIYDYLHKVYKDLGLEVKVSFAHVMQPLHPYNPWNPLDRIPAQIFDYLINDVALEYLTTGKFNWLWIREYNEKAIGKLDFIGLNYYTHTIIGNFKQTERQEFKVEGGDPLKSKPIYAEGFYDCIKRAAAYGLSIFITENGFAPEDPALREEYFKRHLYVVSKAIGEGIDIVGYLVWTLIDTYTWAHGNIERHGLYKVNFETQERTLKPGTEYFFDVVKNSRGLILD